MTRTIFDQRIAYRLSILVTGERYMVQGGNWTVYRFTIGLHTLDRVYYVVLTEFSDTIHIAKSR